MIRGLGGLAVVFRVLASPVAALVRTLAVAGAALMLNPWVAAAVGIAALSYVLYQNRDAIRAWVKNNPLLGGALIGAGALASFATLRGAIGGVATALGVVARLLLANPWVALATGLAVVAYEIYEHWDQIVAYVQKKVEWLKSELSSLWSDMRAKFSDAFSGEALDRLGHKFADPWKERWRELFGGGEAARQPNAFDYYRARKGLATIPDKMSEAGATTINKTVNAPISAPVSVTINATMNNTTPQAVAGAVAAAGSSVASKISGALSDRAQ